LGFFASREAWHHPAVDKKPPKTAARRKMETKPVARKPVTKKAVANKPARKNIAAKNPAATIKLATKNPVVAKKPGPRADFGAPIEGFFVKQPSHLRVILETLRTLVEEAAPDAQATIKWGMPFYTLGGAMVCALAGFKAHVNLILAGPPEIFTDSAGLLEGDGKTGRHLKVRKLDELPRGAVRGWLRTAVAHARRGGE
jgi:hypothetical protein